jgi:hypothetical protein
MLLLLAGVRLFACTQLPKPPDDTTGTEPVETLPGDTAATTTDTDSHDTTDTGPWEPRSFAHLPVLMLDTGGVSVTTLYKIDGTLDVITDHDGTLTDLDASPREFTGPIGVEMHGMSSTGYPKLSFRFEVRDDAGNDLDTDLLGLGSDSDYVLVASYGDKTYIRNPLVYGLGRTLAEGTDRYEPRTQLVELYYNGDYFGIYTLTGRIKRDGARVDLPAPAPDAASGDLSGGYIIKLEAGRDPGWATARGTQISWSDPQADQITADPAEYLRDWFDAFETGLDADPSAEIDVDAWIDHVLVQELSHNVDGMRLSTYLYKRADADGGQLVAGPLWDFDRSFGNVSDCNCWRTEGWIEDDLDTCGYGGQFASWWRTVRSDPDVERRMRCRWDELRAGEFADDALDARIGALLDQVREAEPRDQDKWQTLGRNVGFNHYVGATWDDEITYLLDWTHERAAWIDANLAGTCD